MMNSLNGTSPQGRGWVTLSSFFFTVSPFGGALQISCPFLSVSIIHCSEFSMFLFSFSGVILFVLPADVLGIPLPLVASINLCFSSFYYMGIVC